MCRFLLIKSKKPIKSDPFLRDFAKMCKNNTQWQGDGWGAAQMLDTGSWILDKSLKPIWEDKDKFKKIPISKLLVVHARWASFDYQKGDIEFNQPYIDDDICFVFNGLLSGVRFSAPGEIGSQKIFNLLKSRLKKDDGATALKKVHKLLKENSREISGLNIGLVVDGRFHVLCDFEERPEYFTVRYYMDDDLTIVCSEEIGNYKWKSMKKGEIKKFS